MVRDSVQLETAVNTITHEYLLEFTSEYGISKMLRPELPGPGDRIVDFPEGKVGVYTRFFEFANFRLPLSQFLFDVLGYYQIHISQLSVIGLPSKRPGKNTPQCYSKPLDSLKNWNNRFSEWTSVYSPCCGVADKCVQRWDAGEWYLFRGGCEGAGYASYPYPKTTGGATVFEMDLFSLIRAPNPTKVKTGSRPRAPHELPLLTLTAYRVIEMDEPSVATDSSGAAPVVVEPPVQESRKRGREGIDANAPPKSLRRDHADLQPSGSSRGGKSLAAMQLCLASNIFVYEGVPADVSDPDPLAFVDTPSPPPTDVIRSSQGVAAAGDPRSEKVSSSTVVGSPGSVYRPEWGVTNGSLLDTSEACQDLVDHAAPPGYFSELRHMHNEDFLGQYNMHLARHVDTLQQQVSGEETLKAAFEDYKRQQDQMVEQRCAEMDVRLDAMSVDFDEELYPHMLTAIAGHMWVIGHGLRLTTMKCVESMEMRQAFTDVVSAGIAKGMSEGMKHGVEHGHAQRTIESLEAYDPEAKAKFAAALQSLKDLKLPLLDQLEGLKDAPMNVIMASLYLEDDTGDDALQFKRDLRPSSSQLAIPLYPEVRDPRNPWAYIEEIKLADAIAANINRAEQKKGSRIVCRTHGVGFAHHARSDRVPVFAPIVVPQGLALILVDAAT
nr:hypothetical protein [Tanacetum cinerariifolium]